jgi:hypothetical protein
MDIGNIKNFLYALLEATKHNANDFIYVKVSIDSRHYDAVHRPNSDDFIYEEVSMIQLCFMFLINQI